MLNKIFNTRLVYILLGLLGLEGLSLLAYFVPAISNIIFIILGLSVLVLALYRLEYGILAVLAELFLTSNGYWFFYDFSGTVISLRIALWVIILAVWAYYFLRDSYSHFKTNKFNIANVKHYLTPDFAYTREYLVLGLVLVLSLVQGFLQGHEFNNIFFDFNNWLYLLLIFPLYYAFKHSKSGFFYLLIQVFLACLIWMGLKTYILLFIFSHDFNYLASHLYDWVRDTKVGEITEIDHSFYRIFFQSQVYYILGFFLTLIYGLKNVASLANKYKFGLFFLASFFLSIIILSFSRSFWVGLVAALGLLFLLYVIDYGFKKTLFSVGRVLGIFIASLVLITVVIKFPVGDTDSSRFSGQELKERANVTKSGAAISSRWSLLPVMFEEIKKRPVRGYGFGKTLTYKSSDPRVLEENPKGNYTTYAFEWSWLGIWLKTGLFGLIIFLYLLIRIIWDSFKVKPQYWVVTRSLVLTLIAFIFLNIFTPYLNHPLGLGFLLLISLGISCMPKKPKSI